MDPKEQMEVEVSMANRLQLVCGESTRQLIVAQRTSNQQRSQSQLGFTELTLPSNVGGDDNMHGDVAGHEHLHKAKQDPQKTTWTHLPVSTISPDMASVVLEPNL